MAPSRHERNNLPPFAEIRGGSIAALRKGDLLSVAIELGLPLPEDINKATVPELKNAITAALATPQVASDNRFLKFIVYRTKTTGGAAIKNSVEKAREDAAAQKEDVAPTGAHLTLLEGKSTSDPAPQHRRLLQDGDGAGGQAERRKFISVYGREGTEIMFPEPSSPLTEASSQVSDKLVNSNVKPSSPPKQASLDLPSQDEVNLPVKVHFTGIGTSSREVYILPSVRQDIVIYKAPDGTYTTSLKKLIPAVIVQFSSATDQSEYKISITGTTGSPLFLGTIGQFKSGDLHPVLELSQADTCTLEAEGSVLVCNLLLERRAATVTNENRPTQILPKMKPLEIANARPKSKTKRKTDVDHSDNDHDWPENMTDRSFLAFLNRELRGKENGYGASLSTAGEMLVRWRDLTSAVAICNESWKSYNKGSPYCVPAEYKDRDDESVHQYANRPFTKAHLVKALKIGSSITTLDKDMFENPGLQFAPLARRWVDQDPELTVEENKRFSKMSRNDFLAYIQERKDRETGKQRENAARESKKTKRVRRSQPDDESDSSIMDSEEERRVKRKLKKAHKARKEALEGVAGPSSHKSRRATSEHLDD
ncbi:hypothetical protein C8R43DRAFT_1108102 [Mycena crocata]|nr:hypothetical protein C8R43DRAFT_1108102 [Mycena crocata]